MEGLRPQGRTVESLEIPPRPWHMSPGETLSRSLSSMLRSGFLHGPEEGGGWGPVSGCVEGTRSGGITTIHRALALSPVIYGHGLTGQTTPFTRYCCPSFTGKGMDGSPGEGNCLGSPRQEVAHWISGWVPRLQKPVA